MIDTVIIERRHFDAAALRSLCAADPELRVAGLSTSLDPDAVRRALRHTSGLAVVLVGRTLLRENGALSVQRLRQAQPYVRIILVGIGEEDALRLEAIRVGADGFLRRDGDVAAQLEAIKGHDGAVAGWNGGDSTAAAS
jgi:DNA-binding NarL/FixJ family response regulator